MTQKKDLTYSSESVKAIATPTFRVANRDSLKSSAFIGPSITIRGDVSGEEDLVVAGTIEGAVNLKESTLMVDESGYIMADITAAIIRVDGEVKGELRAIDKVIIKSTGNVVGGIRSPRVVLEDGCQFKGSIDMDFSKSLLSSDRAHPPKMRPPALRPADTNHNKYDSTDKLIN
jgi:cytoskeletal protein CcmA (bactofilin family)